MDNKEMMPLAILALLALVAIVALAVLVLGGRQQTLALSDENVAGDALRRSLTPAEICTGSCNTICDIKPGTPMTTSQSTCFQNCMYNCNEQ